MKITVLSALPLVLLLFFLSAWSATSNNLDDACKVTEYRKLCEKSLAPYARGAGKSPNKWAQAGLLAAIDDAKAWSDYVSHIKVRGPIASAVSVCLELADEVVDLLNRSLKFVRALKRRGSDEGMDDLRTWLSAAVTNGGTCVDGFKETRSARSETAKAVIRRAEISMYLVSNAHALVLRLAKSG